MPFLDELGGMLSRAGEDLSKAGRVNQLKAQLGELTGKRQVLILQLGELLLAQLQEKGEAEAPFEEAYKSILALDDERKTIEAELEELAPATPAPNQVVKTCPHCGAAIDSETIFCENCGQRVSAGGSEQ